MKRNYQDPAYEQFRKDVLKRDNRQCRMPNCSSRSSLQVHHIKRWAHAHALRYDTSNGITLCRKCHNSIRGKEHYYEGLFYQIIQNET